VSETKEIDVLAGLIVNSLVEVSRQRAIYAGGGQPGNTKRTKLWDEFGYPAQLSFDHFLTMYERNAVAFGAVHKLLEGCWADCPVIVDGDASKKAKKTTPWEKAVTKLMKKHWSKVKDADRRNLVGHYSALLIQVKDSKNWDQPIGSGSLKSLGGKALVKLIPVWEPQLKVTAWQDDQTSDDYGMPTMYNFDERPVGDNTQAGPTRGIAVHPDRVIIFCEGSEDESIFSGVPLLKAGYNKLLDLEKISGGSAEGFLKNASRQLGINFAPEASLEEILRQAKLQGYENLAEAMNGQIGKLNRGVDGALNTQGAEVKVLSVAAADPKPTWEVTANELCSSLLVPFTIQFGQQTGRLASDEDKTDWAKRLNGRRGGFMSDRVTALLERLWTIGIIDPPKSGEMTLEWSDLLAPSEKEKIANMQALATVAKDSQTAFGTPAVTTNEIREAGEMEPIPEAAEPTGADELNKQKKGDPLVDDDPATDANKNADNTPQ